MQTNVNTVSFSRRDTTRLNNIIRVEANNRKVSVRLFNRHNRPPDIEKRDKSNKHSKNIVSLPVLSVDFNLIIHFFIKILGIIF